MYWIVKNGEIIEFIKTLPTSTANISWLDKLPEDKLRELGYYKVIWASEPLQEWQSYWQASYEIWTEYITETKEVINEELESFKNKKIAEQSEKTKQIILSKYSEIEQTNLLREGMRLQFNLNTWQEVDIERVVYIQSVDNWIEEQRANYKELKQSILEAESYEEVISLIPILETKEI